jgi:glycerol-3-phosphate dehydrogenase (NAD(P)+)
MSENVCIIGNGAWGKALFHVISQNTKHVRIAKRGEIVQEPIIILAVPTQSLRDLRSVLQPKVKKPVIINTAKGIERLTHKLPRDIMQEFIPDCHYYALIGPSFAEEVTQNMPTVVNLGYEKASKRNEEMRDLFQTDYFRVKLTRGVEALELSGALKNIYAIGCGLADGIGYQTNTRIQLIMLAIEEMQQLFQKLHITIDRSSLPGTIGDLILTCNSSESRNFRFGQFLAKYNAEESLKKVGATVEGYASLNSIRFLEQKTGIELPLAELIRMIVFEGSGSSAKKMFKEFIMIT